MRGPARPRLSPRNMSDEQRQFLGLMGMPPARLTARQCAWVLNCQLHDIPVLVAAGLLKPLGEPAPNSTKWFATVEVLLLARDRVWLGKVTRALGRYWQRKNEAKCSHRGAALPLRQGDDPPPAARQAFA